MSTSMTSMSVPTAKYVTVDNVCITASPQDTKYKHIFAGHLVIVLI